MASAMLADTYPKHGEGGVLARNNSKKAWLVCLSAGLFFFYEFIQMHMFNAINEELRTAFNVNATQLGVLSSTYLFGDVLFLLPAGMLLDRFSVRKILLVALSVCIFGTAGFALTHSLPAAAFFHTVSGCGHAFCFLSCIVLISRWFAPERQAFVVGIVVTMAFLGGVLAQTPLVWLAHAVGWRTALMYDVLLGGVIFAIIFIQVRDFPPGYIKPQNPLKAASGFLDFFQGLIEAARNAQNLLAGLYTSLLNLPIMVLDAVWGVTYLVKVHQLTQIQASNVTAMIFFGSIVACPFVGLLSDRIGLRKKPMIWGGILSLLSILLVVLIPELHYPSLLVLFFLIGLFTSTQIVSYPLAAESNDSRITGTAVSIVSFIIMGGAALAQILFGKLLDLSWNGLLGEDGQRIYSSLDYQHAMWMFPVAIGIGLLAALLLKETYCRKKEV